MAIKTEADLWEGPVCWIGPKGLGLLMAAKGLPFGITTLDELEGQEELPQPLTLVYHNVHWVPMWSKGVFEESQARPWLPPESHQPFQERFAPVAERLGAHVDTTGRAAGDCAFHALLILQDIWIKHGVQPPGHRGTVPRTRQEVGTLKPSAPW